MKKLNNKGITLVELLVSIAIFSVIMVCLFRMLTVSTKQYNSNNLEVQVQNEAQMLMSQIESRIMDANYGVNYYKDSEVEVTFPKVTGIAVAEKEAGSFILYDAGLHNVYLFTYDADDVKDLYTAAKSNSDRVTAIARLGALSQYVNRSSSGGKLDSVDTKRNALIAENVTSFSADASKVVSHGYISVFLTIEKEGKSFSCSKNIHIRNTHEINGGHTGA